MLVSRSIRKICTAACLAAVTAALILAQNTPAHASTAMLNSLRGLENVLSNKASMVESSCEADFKRAVDTFERTPAASHFPAALAKRVSKHELNRELDRVFKLRLALNKMTRSLRTSSPSCMRQIRRASNALIAAEAMVSEIYSDRGFATYEREELFVGPFPFQANNPAVGVGAKGKVDIRAGDVMIARGDTVVSAFISQSADHPGEFSHAAVIGEDSKGRLYVVEVFSESGLTVVPLADFDVTEWERVALLRFNDPQLGEEKSRAIAKDVARKIFRFSVPDENKRDSDGDLVVRKVLYDYSFIPGSAETMFCTEVVYHAYKWAGVNIPHMRSTYSGLHRTHLAADLSFRGRNSIAPSDFELDPRFELIAESRSMESLMSVQYKSLAVRKVLEWMKRDKYEFAASLGHGALAHIAVAARSMGLLSSRISEQDTPMIIKTALKLGGAVEIIGIWIEKRAEAHKKATGATLTARELDAMIERDLYVDCVRSQSEVTSGDPERRSAGPNEPPAFLHSIIVAPANRCDLVMQKYWTN